MALQEGLPKVAVLSSYHGQRAIDFAQAGELFKPLKVDLIHPPTFQLIDSDVPNNVFVLREGDPGVLHHVLQIQELRRMRQLQKETPGNGFGYVVDEDGAVGMHTAGEMAFLALQGIPVVASKLLTSFREVPRYAQDTLRATIQEIFPLDHLNQEHLNALQERLDRQPRPIYSAQERRILSKLVKDALLQQRFEGNLYRALVTSESKIKKQAYTEALRKRYPDKYIVVDTIKTALPHIPKQPFQEQGQQGARERIEYALLETAGFPYHEVGSYENCMVAFDPQKFQQDTWATTDKWASNEQIAKGAESLVYADVACFVRLDPKTGRRIVAYSRPVVIPTEIALEALQRGPDTLYAQVLQEKDPRVDKNDPHTGLGDYSRQQQLFDITSAVIEYF